MFSIQTSSQVGIHVHVNTLAVALAITFPTTPISPWPWDYIGPEAWPKAWPSYKHTLKSLFFQVCFVLSQTNEIQDHDWKNSIVNWLTLRRQDKRIPSCMSWIPRPLPWRVYLVPLTLRTDVRAYGDAITTFSRIDRFPFSIPMKSPLWRWTQQTGRLSMYGSSGLSSWSTAALPRRPWVRIPLEPWSFNCHYNNDIQI